MVKEPSGKPSKEEIFQVISKTINKIYYREFSDDAACELIDVLKNAVTKDLIENDKELAFDIISTPFKLLKELSTYTDDSPLDRSIYSISEERMRIETLADLVYQIVLMKLRGADTSNIEWLNPVRRKA